MANTTNIDLVKPAGTDYALISVINSNYDKIDTEAGKVRSNMALVQNTNTATEAIAKDQLVLWKGVLKKATSAIASGATLSASNLANTDIANELAALNNQIANVLQINLGDITGTSAGNAVGNAWDAITQYDVPVMGQFQYSGRWMFQAYKYSGSQYGMIVATRYNGVILYVYIEGGVKTVKTVSIV